MPPYGSLEGAFPVAEALAESGLSLPSGPRITDAELSVVSEELASALDTLQ
jgi:dTDP-4-amino-4,6-dideoxygalactose transaminase